MPRHFWKERQDGGLQAWRWQLAAVPPGLGRERDVVHRLKGSNAILAERRSQQKKIGQFDKDSLLTALWWPKGSRRKKKLFCWQAVASLSSLWSLWSLWPLFWSLWLFSDLFLTSFAYFYSFSFFFKHFFVSLYDLFFDLFVTSLTLWPNFDLFDLSDLSHLSDLCNWEPGPQCVKGF